MAFFLLPGLGCPADPPTAEIGWRKGMGFAFPTHPLCGDFDLDGKPEVLLADKAGKVVLLSPEGKGKTYWEADLGDAPLLPPVNGRFLQDSGQEIALLQQNGDLRILHAASGREIFRGNLAAVAGKASYALAPSLLPAREADKRDTLLVVSEQRRLLNLSFQGAESFSDEWAAQPIGTLADMPLQALAVGRMPTRMDLAGALSVAYVALGSKVAILNAAHPEWPANTVLSVSIGSEPAPLGLAEDRNGMVRRIIVSDTSGNLLQFSPTPPEPTRRPIELLGTSRIGCAQKPGSPPAIADLNGDGVVDYMIANESRIVVVDGNTGSLMSGLESYHTVQRFITPPVLLVAKDGEAYAVAGDEGDGIQIINLRRHRDPSHVPRVQGGKALAPATPLVLDADGDDMADVLACTIDGAILIRTSLAFGTGDAQWPAWGGSPLHTGGVPAWYVRQVEQRALGLRQDMEQKLGEARSLLEQEQYEAARDMAQQILAINPRHEGALEIRHAALSRLNRLSRLLYGGVGLGILALAGLLAWRWIATWKLRRATLQWAEEGKADRVLEAFRKHFRFHRGQKSVVAHLAALACKMGIAPEEFAPRFERALQARPNDGPLRLVLAKIYLQNKRADEETVPFYEAACKAGGDVAAYESLLGRIHLANKQYAEAHGYLKSAFEHNDRSPELYEGLAQVYLALGRISPRHISIFEGALRAKPDDARYLEGLAKAYVLASRQTDPKAQKVFQRLAQLKPDSPTANQEIAAAHCRNGQYEEAAAAARIALKSEPENPSALVVLAVCYWQKRDLSAEARDVYRKAWFHHPGDPVLLRIIAQLDLERESLDSDTEKRILQAIELNPRETDFLSEAAAAAERWDNAAVARAALGALQDMDALNDGQALQLARLLVRRGDANGSHADLLLRAFQLQPDLEGLALALGEIVASEKRLDAKYLPLINYLADVDCGNTRWFVHLSRIHEAQGQFDAMAKTLEAALVVDSSQIEVQRLLAVAHANLRQFSEAISHYQALLRAEPNDAEALAGLGRAYAQMENRTDEMDLAILRALDLAPDDALLNLAAGQIGVQKGKWGDAASRLNIALRAGDEQRQRVLNYVETIATSEQGLRSVPAQWLRIQILLFTSQFDEVARLTEAVYSLDRGEAPRIVDVLDRILKADHGNAEALFAKGRILHRKGANAEAQSLLEKAVEIKPDHEAARSLVLDVYEKLLAERDDAGLRFRMGEAALAIREYDRAVACFQKTRLDASLEMASTRHLAECFLYKGLYDLALQEFQNLPVDEETKPLLYMLGQEFEARRAMASARLAYQKVYAVDAGYEDVSERLNRVSGTTSSTSFQNMAAHEKSTIFAGLSESAKHRYELLEELGRGSMGIVYKARDSELDEIVALKILPDNLSKNPEAVRRFRQEARNARRLSHVNIIRIHDIGEEHGRKYISMEFIQGTTLKDLIRRSDLALPRQTILNFSRQIATAMQYAHGIGIVHRDLKPANIMVTNEGIAKVTDFGIAKAMELPQQTLAGAMVGTPLYMSPEQVLGQSLDHRADIYSFGVMFYEMLNGKPPFSTGDLAYQHMHVEPRPIEGIEPVLLEIVMRCLRKKPDDRWGSFTDILAEMDKVAPEKDEAEGGNI